MARMEGHIAISTMLRRLPGLRLAQRRVRWKKGIVFRSMRELRVRF
jgi:cytochrome P450